MRTALPPPAYERENSATREDGSVLPSGPSSLRAAALADEDAAAHRSQELIVLRAMLHLEALKRDVQIDFLYCSHVRVASRANRSYKDVTSTRGKTDGGRRWASPYPACLCFLTAVPLSFVRGRDLNRNMTDACRTSSKSLPLSLLACNRSRISATLHCHSGRARMCSHGQGVKRCDHGKGSEALRRHLRIQRCLSRLLDLQRA